jgi:hypothetical protein
MAPPAEDWQDAEEVLAGPFRVTPGFVAFVAALILPALIALAVFVGASLVANEVYAADRATASKMQEPNGFASGGRGAPEPATWKRTLVGVCPLH